LNPSHSTTSAAPAATPAERLVAQFLQRPVRGVDYARALSNRGRALLDQGMHAEALVVFERALGFDASFAAARQGRADTLVAMGQHRAAKRELEVLRAGTLAPGPDQHRDATDHGRLAAIRPDARIRRTPGLDTSYLPLVTLPLVALAAAALLFRGAWIAADKASQDRTPRSEWRSEASPPGSAGRFLRESAAAGNSALRFAPAPPPAESPQLAVATEVPDRQARLRLGQHISSAYATPVSLAGDIVDEAFLVGRQLQIDPFLLLAIIAVESRFDPQAQSPRGAQGLMQVLTVVHADRFNAFGGVTAAFDFAANIRIGAQILSEYLRRHGSINLALKHYVGAARMENDQGYATKIGRLRDQFETVARRTGVLAAS
jgi:soluble lytic murein transglycosylase-like protein